MMNYKKATSEIKQIMYDYKLAQLYMIQGIEKEIYFNNKLISNLKYIEIIDFIISNLNPQETKIIQNNFLTEQYEYWWYDFYSRATYYRLTKSVYQKFLNFIHDGVIYA